MHSQEDILRYFVLIPGLCGSDRAFFPYLERHLESSYVYNILYLNFQKGTDCLCFQTGVVVIDGWLRLSAAAQTAVLFKQLRITLDAVLKELTRKPEVCIFLLLNMQRGKEWPADVLETAAASLAHLCMQQLNFRLLYHRNA